MRTFVDLDDAWRMTREAVGPVPAEIVPLGRALGRTLAADVHADVDAPPFDNSAMDGYAVRAADLATSPAVLPIAGGVRAGEWPSGSLRPGTCWSITTGSPIPDGADTIVPVEETESAGDGMVRFGRPVEAGRHVRRAGRDMRSGDLLLSAGAIVTPPVTGILAMVGYAEVPVRRVPTVAVVATGDELVPVDRAPGPGQIRNSNAVALAAQVTAAGGRPTDPIHARDDRASTREAIDRARTADVLVFSGGVSMGTHDIVRRELEDAGMRPVYWKVRQRPGKPLAFGVLDGRPVFGLPGNPVSSSICFDQHVRPAIAVMLGRTTARRPRFDAVLQDDIPKPGGLHVFARGIASAADDGRIHVRSTGPQGSNLFTSVLRANCLIHLPAPLPAAGAGSRVEIEWLDW